MTDSVTASEPSESIGVDSPTHVAFADESSYNTKRYRSIGLVTLAQTDYARCVEDVRRIQRASGVRELKWQRLDSAQMRFAIEHTLRYVVEQATHGVLRLDVLIWDIEDSRHKIAGRDDIANLQRMYYHLFKNVLRRRWSAGSIWRLHPDQNSAIDWPHLSEYVDDAGLHFEIEGDDFAGNGFKIRLQQDFRIEHIVPCESHTQPLVQVADVFAGMAVYSWRAYDTYEHWLHWNAPQASSLTMETSGLKLSQGDHERCYILAQFDALCKQRRLGVSLKSQRGLATRNPDRPINFWRYVPQHENDKAPTRSQA
ncbi:MAG TPA: DUF3800 domain-containing protein [Anaerolineae bacterium]|nr:DUF3800 domain-containing protein [Anaerolineae bacterium]